jgi:hypothetical protein
MDVLWVSVRMQTDYCLIQIKIYLQTEVSGYGNNGILIVIR